MFNKLAARVAAYLVNSVSVWIFTGYPVEAMIVAVIRSSFRQGGKTLMQQTAGKIALAVADAMEGIVQCTACGSEIPEGKKFCPDCGTDTRTGEIKPLPDPEPPPPPEPAAPKLSMLDRLFGGGL